MRKLLLFATILLIGAAVVRQLIPAERRAEFRERLSHQTGECDCDCHGSEIDEPAAEEEKEPEPATTV